MTKLEIIYALDTLACTVQRSAEGLVCNDLPYDAHYAASMALVGQIAREIERVSND